MMTRRDHPYWTGALLGLVFALSIVLFQPLGVSTTYSVAGGLILRAADSGVATQEATGEITSNQPYFARNNGALAAKLLQPLTYETALVLLIPVGAFLGALPGRIRRMRRKEKLPRLTWQSCVAGFLGGFVLLFGARMAGGCTSGHMFSGIIQGAVSGFAFTAAAFATAIPAAVLTGRALDGKRL